MLIRETRYPDQAEGYATAGSETTTLLNGMRVEFSERVPLYPVDLEHVPVETRMPNR